MPGTAALLGALREAVGPSNVLVDPDVRAPFEVDWTRRYGGPATCVVRPSTAAEVAAVLRACARAGATVVPQGGNTGLVGGSVPSGSGVAPVVVSTTRLDVLGEIDTAARQVTVGAGVTLARLRAHAGAAGLDFAVDFAARDTATIGGMIATNAGGVHVLAHGSMRAQVLGVEAVLADDSVVSRLSGLVKDNTGYDLSQLLVGSEGTLAVITSARLRLIDRLEHRLVAILGVDGATSAVELVARLRHHVDGLQAAELFFHDGVSLVCAHHGIAEPLAEPSPAYLLIEVAGRSDVTDDVLAAIERLGIDPDRAAVATDDGGRHRLWQYRELLTSTISSITVPHKLDVSLPIGQLAAFVDSMPAAVAASIPGASVICFGHVGDGNLHVNVLGPDPDDDAADSAVLHEVARHGGSISAEHGVGRAKARWLHLSRSASEIAAMRAIKDALDPSGLLNPGVLFEPTQARQPDRQR